MLAILHFLVPALCYSISNQESKYSPAPLQFDFTVSKKFGDLEAREFWAQKNQFSKRDAFAESIDNVQDIYYMMNIYLGSNGQKNYVVVDTGSSDLWVPSSGYDPSTSESAKDTGFPFGARYIDNSIARGEFFTDTLKFGTSDPVLNDFQFAQANASGPGVLGIGNKAQQAAQVKYDNLPWALQKAGVTPKASYSLYLNPDRGSGVIIFGGVDTEKYKDCLSKYPVHNSGQDLAIILKNVKAGEKSMPVSSPYSIDSGTSLGFADKNLMEQLDVVFDAKVVHMGGVDYRMVSCTQPKDKSLSFDFGANEISISYADLIVRNDDGTCLLGLAYYNGYQILGDVFMRHAYMYFDLTDQTIALAQSVGSEKSNIVAA